MKRLPLTKNAIAESMQFDLDRFKNISENLSIDRDKAFAIAEDLKKIADAIIYAANFVA